MSYIYDLAGIAGAGMATYGLYLVWEPLAWVFGGGCLMALGIFGGRALARGGADAAP